MTQTERVLFFDEAYAPASPKEYLAIIKQELHEMSATEGTVIDCGTLAKPENEHLWTGKISLKARLQSGELTESEVNESTATLNEYFVATTPGSPKRCIDGSGLEGYDDTNPDAFNAAKGPQIQGGTADEAFSLRVSEGVPENEEISLLEDIRALPTKRQSQFTEGNHTDDKVDGVTATGCGALDGQGRKLDAYNDPEKAQLIKDMVAVVLGVVNITPADDAFERVQESMKKLAEKTNYLPSAKDVLETLRDINPGCIEKLKRPHNEVSLTINFVPNTTFHRDHYNAQTNSKIQNFNLDAWVILEEYGEQGYALVCDAVATAMDLTDGSLRLFIRVPADMAA